jgi:hypothetical protein
VPAGEEPPPSIAPVTPDDAAARAAVRALLERAGEAGEHPALSESAFVAWRSGRPSAGFLERHDGAPVGYAQVDLRKAAATVELVVDPGALRAGSVRERLLGAAVTAATGTDRGTGPRRSRWASRSSATSCS